MNKNKPMPVRFYRYGYEYVRLPKSVLAGAKTEMVIDPNIQFGEPTIRGTRVPLEILGKRLEEIAFVASDYRVSPEAVKDAREYVNSMPIAPNKEKE